MPVIVCSLAALTVASIFYAWRAHITTMVQRRRQIHQRLAYMLWVMANQVQ